MAWLKKSYYRCSRIEPPGCYNTGFAPTVAHKHYKYPPADFYLVGHEMDVQDGDTAIAAYYAQEQGRTVVRKTLSRHKAYVYKTMAPARKRYEAMCAEARAARDAEVADIQALRAKATTGDMGAALRLGLDY